MIQAFHSTGIVFEDEQRIMYGGMPAGFIIRAEGLTILHAGDTGLFGDMKMFKELYSIDVAFLPIGGLITMGPEEAAIAAEWMGAKLVVPIHYNTFPMINQDVQAFIDLLANRGLKGQALAIGEGLEL
jgi:L-ascorbate metabolism protein UlaG (beta-lactamase superfamily)